MQDGRDTDPAAGRWAGAGHSDSPEPAQASREAVTTAVRGGEPRLVLVFASPRYSLDQVAPAAREAAGPAELIGCSTPGPGERGVSAFALGGRGFSVATAAAPLAGADPREAGQAAARCVAFLDEDLPHRALIALADESAGDPQDVVRGAYSIAGAAVSLAGAAVDGGPEGGEPAQLHGGEALRGSVVAAAVASDAPLGVGVRHGWRPRGDPLLVTFVEARTVYVLNDQFALDAYLDLLDAPPPAREDPAEFARFALRHPFGVAGARGREAQIRAVTGADFQARSLRMAAELPAGSLAWVMEGDRQAVIEATKQACDEALAPLGGRPPLGLLAFDSIARAAVLGSEGDRQARARIEAAAAGAPVGGFRTPGEIARTRGMAGFHGQALALLAIG